MHMPVMDGCQAALTIRQHETQLGKRRQTLIALTASTTGGDREKCLSSGMDDFLGKPVRQDELAKALARWVPNSAAPVSLKKRKLGAITTDGRGRTDTPLREQDFESSASANFATSATNFSA